MRADFFLHGTPNGQSVYSSSSERDDYVLSYDRYDMGIGSHTLVVETKVLNNNLNCYYTYYIQNVQDANGHPGGYFAITLRSDTFVSNLKVMFQIMDIIYNQLVVGSILIDGNVNSFLVKSFNDQGELVFNVFKNILSQVIKARDIVKIDDSFLGNSGSLLSFNPCDSRCVNLLTQYKSAEKIIISPSVSLPRELVKAQEYQNKLNYIKKEFEERNHFQMKKMKTENDSLQSDVKHILCKLHNTEKEGEALRQKISYLEKELQESHYKVQRLSEQAELKKELVNISEPLSRLNGLLQRFEIVATPLQKNQVSIRQIDADTENGKVGNATSNKSKNSWKFFSIILIITSILLLGVLIFQIMLFSKYDNNNALNPNVELITGVEMINENEESEEQSNAKEEKLDNQEKAKDDFQNLRIVIEGQNTYPDGLVAETGYPIGLVDKEGKYVDSLNSIKWDCIGGNIDPPIGNKVHLRTNKSGKIMIICILPNGSTIKRELKVYENKKGSQSLAVAPDFNNMKINIREYHGKGPLQYGRDYSLYISSKGYFNRPNSIKGLRWECDGGEIYKNGGDYARLKLKRKNGLVKIICHFPNGESIVRVIEVSSNE